MKILLSDPKSRGYDIQKILADSGLSNFEVIEENSSKARERIEKREEFNVAIFGYEYNNGKPLELIDFLKKHREIPSIVLVYPSETGVSRYARERRIATVYRNDINFYLGDIIKGNFVK